MRSSGVLIGGWAAVGAVSAAIASLVMCQNQWSNGVTLLFVALSLGEAAVLRLVGLRAVPQVWLMVSPIVALPAAYVVGSLYFTIGLLLWVATFGFPAAAARTGVPLLTYMFYGAAVLTVPIALILTAVQSAILSQGAPSTPVLWWILVAVAGLALGIFVPSSGPMLACHPDQLGEAVGWLPAFALPAVLGAVYGAMRALALRPSVEVARARPVDARRGLGQTRRVRRRTIAALWLHLDVAAPGGERERDEECDESHHPSSLGYRRALRIVIRSTHDPGRRWALGGSNARPQRCQRCALTS